MYVRLGKDKIIELLLKYGTKWLKARKVCNELISRVNKHIGTTVLY